MKLTRPSRLIAACVMLFSMLFMQLAVAAYACPGGAMQDEQMEQAKTENNQDMHEVFMAEHNSVADMAGCTSEDTVQPNLCQAYDHTGHQSLDKPNVPAVSSFIPTTLLLALVTADSSKLSQSFEPQSQKLTRTTAPPLSIQHCCFRL